MTTAPAIASRTARLIARRSGGRIEREIDWTTPIDRSRWFICETLTPLYYTSLYSQLTLEQRRRYNQLTGMFANELIAFLEREFLDAVLKAVSEAPAAATPWDPLRDALAAFRDDEREHALLWQRLNHLSEPDRYVPGVRMFLHVPRAAGALGRLATRQPAVFPVVFWVQLLQEERSIEISRRCSRLPADAIEPRYAAVYRAHLRDEVRHVRIDRLLIEQYYARRPRPIRWMTAAVLQRLLGSVFLVPGRSTRRVVAALTREHPELRALLPAIHRELKSLPANVAYQQMMYSRQTTPVAFELFDRFPEFSRLASVLRAYTPVTRESS